MPMDCYDTIETSLKTNMKSISIYQKAVKQLTHWTINSPVVAGPSKTIDKSIILVLCRQDITNINTKHTAK
jgi:hypothetical protein